jgi:hypothetical protein
MTSMTDHWDVIEGVLEDERDRHIISGGLAANRKEIDAALAFVREQRAQVQQSAMKQYLKGRTTINATLMVGKMATTFSKRIARRYALYAVAMERLKMAHICHRPLMEIGR